MAKNLNVLMQAVDDIDGFLWVFLADYYEWYGRSDYRLIGYGRRFRFGMPIFMNGEDYDRGTVVENID